MKALGVDDHTVLLQWNADRPHFGGSGPHRYDGSDKECSYCLRPLNWKNVDVPKRDSRAVYDAMWGMLINDFDKIHVTPKRFNDMAKQELGKEDSKLNKLAQDFMKSYGKLSEYLRSKS